METTETRWEAKESITPLGQTGDHMTQLYLIKGSNTLNAEGDWEFEELEEIAALLNSEIAADRDHMVLEYAKLIEERDRLKECVKEVEEDRRHVKEALDNQCARELELGMAIKELNMAFEALVKERESLKEENERLASLISRAKEINK